MSLSDTTNLTNPWSEEAFRCVMPRQPPMAELDTQYRGSTGEIYELDGGYPRAAADRSGTPTSDHTRAPTMGTRLLSTIANVQPTASTINRSRTVLHARAKSLAAFVPRFGTATGSAASSVIQEDTPPPSWQSANKLFGDLFSGESAPVRIGVSAQSLREDAEPVLEYKSGLTERPEGSLRRRPTSQSGSSTSTSRKTWFSRKPSVATTTSTGIANDEILNIDINSALFPHGPADPHSPHAFNDLLLNATALLEKMQTAYREKALSLANVQPEVEAQREEVEEAETRSLHLKMQLEGMCRKAEEQERTMQEMAEKLAEEKLKAQQERDRATRSIRLVRGSSTESPSRSVAYGSTQPRERRKRLSEGSNATDSGFESNADSASIASGEARDELELLGETMMPEQSYDGFSAAPRKHHDGESTAWATADTLRHENQRLRAQMDEMQKTLQGCIDFVDTVAV